MQVNIYSINKNSKDEYTLISENLQKMIKKYSSINDISIFNKKISSAQKNQESAKKSYTEALLPNLGAYNIALDVEGKQLDSFEFSKLLEDKINVNFFIGGAFGFEREFLSRCDRVISLSNLTFSHKIAKIVLLEQVFRGFSILNNHPYHK